MHTHKPIIGSILNRSCRSQTPAPGVFRPRRSRLFGAAVLLAGAVLGTSAQATLIAPGGSTLLSGTSAAAQPSLAGTVLQDVTVPFTLSLGGGSTVNGYVQDRVVRETVSGTLDFYYRLFNGIDPCGCTLNSQGSIGVAARSGFSGYTTDVNYRTDGLGTVAPSGASRTANGSTVLFGFMSNPIVPGETSLFSFVKTNATAYNDLGTGTLIGFNTSGGFGQTQFSTFEPVDPVPLPAALWLFASGLLGLVALGR
ncbi:MAG: hypothetical protein ACYDHM_15915, partial [Acidiferrobacterales bacterium]